MNSEYSQQKHTLLKTILNIKLTTIHDLLIVLKKTSQIIECQTIGIFLEQNNRLIYIQTYGKNDSALLYQSISNNESIEGYIFSKGKSVLIEKSIENKYFKPQANTSRIVLPITIVGTPILVEEKVIGGIIAFNRQRNTLFTESDLTILKKISLFVADYIKDCNVIFIDKRAYFINKEIIQSLPFPLFICSTAGIIESYSNISNTISTKTVITNEFIGNIITLLDDKNNAIDFEKLLSELVSLEHELHIKSLHLANHPDRTYDLILKHINPDKMIHNVMLLLIDTEDINNIKRQLITSIAHELRTPLMAIMGSVQILLSDFESNSLSSTQEEFLSILKSQTERFSTILSTILDYKESIDSLGLKEEKTDLKQIFNHIKDIFNEKLKKKNIILKIENFDEETIVKGEKNSLKHIFNQIIDNAIKFSPENSKIIIKNEGTQLITNQWYKLISITDEGKGIDEKILPHIFDSFSRDDEKVHTKIGTGLGLSIVKQLIDTMGGHIEIKNVEPHGIKVKISLKI